MSKHEESHTVIADVSQQMARLYDQSPMTKLYGKKHLPQWKEVGAIIKDLQKLIFPKHFSDKDLLGIDPLDYSRELLIRIRDRLKTQIALALDFCHEIDCTDKDAEELCNALIRRIPHIQELLLKDVQAIFDGDPAAKNVEEIILSYPGFLAIFIFRFAHELYQLKVPLVPRMMTEYAHGKTGIDINPGATIGESFFIDHGTGVVIGETTVIGNHVKLYQGVTLGALSTQKGQELAGKKRHPDVGDRVTIYSGATILGGDTVIGEDVVVGGNVFLTKSVAPKTTVTLKEPDLKFKNRNLQK